jgi:hypothetical protein
LILRKTRRAIIYLNCRSVLACMFHAGGCVSHEFGKLINLTGMFSDIVTQEQFVPIHFQEKSGVTD